MSADQTAKQDDRKLSGNTTGVFILGGKGFGGPSTQERGYSASFPMQVGRGFSARLTPKEDWGQPISLRAAWFQALSMPS